MFHALTVGIPPLFSILLFLGLWLLFWRSHKKQGSFYFDAQDFLYYEGGNGRELPVSAKQGTFSESLKHYITVSQLLITVAAASIAFGGNQNPKRGIVAAKAVLACAILFGVTFCALLLYCYDEYAQNVRAYTRFYYSLIQALGFSTLACFILGYFVWAFNLGP